jgi:hypothetical protein
MTRNRDVANVLTAASSLATDTETAAAITTHASAADPHTNYAPKASPTFTGKITNTTSGIYAELGTNNRGFYRNITTPAKTVASGTAETFSIYLGRAYAHKMRMNIMITGAFSEDAAEYTFNKSYAATPYITLLHGTNFETSTYYHNSMTFHFVNVNEMTYDIFIRFTYNSNVPLGTTLGMHINIEQLASVAFSVPSGVTVPTLNASNKIGVVSIIDGYQGNFIANPNTSLYTSSATLAGQDWGRIIDYNSASAGTLTIPPNSVLPLPQNAQIMFIQTNTGQLTVGAGAGVTLYSFGSKFKTANQYAAITAWQRNIDSWVLFGNLA